MKKNIISLAILLASAFSFTAIAQKPADCCNKAPGVCAAGPGVCATTDSAACRMKPCEFAGLDLTDAQKAQIKALKADRKAKAEANRKARGECRKDYLKSIKGILTPEQYVTFLENNFVNGAKAPRHGGKDMKARHGGRDFKKGGRDAKRPCDLPATKAEAKTKTK